MVIDPYNDFISEGGKIWRPALGRSRSKQLRSRTCWKSCMPCGRRSLGVFYAMHHRYRAGDYDSWKYIAPIQRAAWQREDFEFGTWGGEFRPSSTLSRAKLLRMSTGVQAASPTPISTSSSRSIAFIELIVIGLIAHTCIEATCAYAAELGYEVTVVKDATADYWRR